MNPDNQVVIDNFTIPDELAKELSELLVKQTINNNLMLQVIEDEVKYEAMLEKSVPVTAKIEAIKTRITKEFVPPKYASSRYMWNYEGWEVSGNGVQILTDRK